MDDIDLSKITALAIEDDLGGVAMISSLMRRLGINATIDSVGIAVLDIAHDMDPPPDIILLDLKLPHKTGFDILRELRQDTQFKNTLIVAITAIDATVVMEKCREAGFDGYISKPLRRERFADQLRRVLRGDSVWEID